MNRIKINELRIKGVTKDYFLTFKQGLNIISGEISTGKTSILELIDYCFGDTECPTYPELLKKGTSALLEIEINNEIFTIERQLFSKRLRENIHSCKISDLQSIHEIISVNSSQKKGEESISSFVLSKIGLKGVKLKEAPKQDVSDVDTMSFRDILWFCYLQRIRVAGAELLFESNYMKGHKLVQVFDVLFDLHSETLAALAEELKVTQESIENKERDEKILLNFANNQGFLTLEKLEAQRGRLLQENEDSKQKLSSIDENISGSSDLAKDLQEAVLKLRARLQVIRNEKRGYEKTLQRLTPLRAQYYEDISKLHFLNQVKKIIDPLSIVVCPRCLSSLELKEMKDNCPLCGKPILDSDLPIDVTKEIRSIERKLDELSIYIKELEDSIKQNESNDKELSDKLTLAGKKLDETLKSFVSPYLTEREGLVSSISTNENEVKHTDESIKLRKDIREISEQIVRLKAKEREIEANIAEERKKSVNRKELIDSLSKTFYDSLKKVNFPKLNEASIDEKLVPYVRGQRYNQLSSEGAINLSSICWLASIFREAINRSMHHPGFLMLDGVQSGIGISPRADKEFRDESIVEGLYSLLREISKIDDECQLIVVDNHPPKYVEADVRVYYSGDALKPPYGFIDDEIV
jgi:DNA repair exonuclease SbcCD ATPase subunit